MSGDVEADAREMLARVMAPGEAAAAVARVRKLLADQRDYCSRNRYDEPSWVRSVDDALNGAP